jgi:addiction module HigA family antidote
MSILGERFRFEYGGYAGIREFPNAREPIVAALKRRSYIAKKLPPVHPGEILRAEFLVPLKLTPYAVAAALHVPRTRIERIAREEKSVTADTALRLGKFFKTGAAFWMNIQARFDLETAEDALAPQIRKIAAYEAA